MTEYRIRSEETWARARDAYLAGETAEGVCSRFDLGLRTFRARAADEGWRRADQPDPGAFEIEHDAELDDVVSDAELRLIARTRMALAARRGLVGEALRWARLREVIDRQAQAEARLKRELARETARADHEENRRTNTLLRDVTAVARSVEASARAALATDRATEVLHDLHDLHDLHPVSDDTDPAPPNAANTPENDDDALNPPPLAGEGDRAKRGGGGGYAANLSERDTAARRPKTHARQPPPPSCRWSPPVKNEGGSGRLTSDMPISSPAVALRPCPGHIGA